MSLPLIIPQSAGSERSCTALHVLRPCINKAEQRLALLVKRLQEWQEYRRAESELSATVADRRKAAKAAAGARSHSQAQAQTQNGFANLHLLQVTEHSSDDDYEQLDDDTLTSDFSPNLAAVTSLLRRLDVMQERLSEALRCEKQLVTELRADLRQLDMKRLEELPKIAQHEHEEYFVNLTELEWQTVYAGRQEIRIDHKLAGAEGQLSRITQELDFFSEYKPVMVQKMTEDREAIVQLQKEDAEAADLLAQHEMDLGASENMLLIETEATRIASMEVQRNVNAAHSALQRSQKALSQAKQKHSEDLHSLVQIRETVRQAKESVVRLDQDIVETKEKREDLTVKVECLAVSIKEALQDQEVEDLKNEKLEKDRLRKLAEEKAVEDSQSMILAEVRRQQHKANETLKNMKDGIRRMQEEAARADREVVQAAKGFERARKELNRIQEQMAVITEDYAAKNEEKKGVDGIIKHCRQVLKESEGSLITELDQLKRNEEEEDKMLAVIEARIIADQHQMRDNHEDNKQKQTRGCEMLVKVENQERKLVDKVEELSKEWEVCEETRNTLRDQVQEATTELQGVEDDLLGQITPLEPLKQQLSDDVTAGGNLIRELEWEQNMLSKKLQDTKDSRGVIDKLKHKTEQEIQALMSSLEEKQQVIREGRELEQRLEAELKEMKHFRHQAADKHGQYMAVQHEMLQKYRDNLKAELTRNQELADHYKQSQQKSMYAKQQLTETLEQRSQLDESLRDHKQLVDWQRRMHRSLESEYKRRKQDGHQQLAVFATEACRNRGTLLRVEEDLSAAAGSVKTFLQSQDL